MYKALRFPVKGIAKSDYKLELLKMLLLEGSK